jgi:uncharacterized delta-60 repeat protein
MLVGACSSSSPCVYYQANSVANIQPAEGLDTSFGGSGQVVSGFGQKTNNRKLFVLGDGAILAAGLAANSVTLAKYRFDGTLADDWGNGGKKIIALDFDPQDLAFQADGRLIVGGIDHAGQNASMVAVRMALDGSIDPTFGNTGKIVVGFGPNTSFRFNAIAVQNNDTFTMIGTASRTYLIDLIVQPITVPISATTELAFYRGLGNGSPDPNFGTDGRVYRTGVEAATLLSTINTALQTDDGSLYLAGDSYDLDGQQLSVVRLQPNGNVDASWGTLDRARAAFGVGHSEALSLAKDESGRIVVSGRVLEKARYDGVLARFTPRGALDPSFGDGGKIRAHDPADFDLSLESVTLTPENKMIVAGFRRGPVEFPSIATRACLALTAHADHTFFAVSRYLPNGLIDAGFGESGRMSLDFGGLFAIAHTILIYPALPANDAGRILVGGEADGSFGLARLLP